MTEPLPIYKIKGKFYFLDRKLGEYRNIKNPDDRIKFNDFPELQKPTEKDYKKLVLMGFRVWETSDEFQQGQDAWENRRNF